MAESQGEEEEWGDLGCSALPQEAEDAVIHEAARVLAVVARRVAEDVEQVARVSAEWVVEAQVSVEVAVVAARRVAADAERAAQVVAVGVEPVVQDAAEAQAARVAAQDAEQAAQVLAEAQDEAAQGAVAAPGAAHFLVAVRDAVRVF